MGPFGVVFQKKREFATASPVVEEAVHLLQRVIKYHDSIMSCKIGLWTGFVASKIASSPIGNNLELSRDLKLVFIRFAQLTKELFLIRSFYSEQNKTQETSFENTLVDSQIVNLFDWNQEKVLSWFGSVEESLRSLNKTVQTEEKEDQRNAIRELMNTFFGSQLVLESAKSLNEDACTNPLVIPYLMMNDGAFQDSYRIVVQFIRRCPSFQTYWKEEGLSFVMAKVALLVNQEPEFKLSTQQNLKDQVLEELFSIKNPSGCMPIQLMKVQEWFLLRNYQGVLENIVHVLQHEFHEGHDSWGHLTSLFRLKMSLFRMEFFSSLVFTFIHQTEFYENFCRCVSVRDKENASFTMELHSCPPIEEEVNNDWRIDDYSCQPADLQHLVQKCFVFLLENANLIPESSSFTDLLRESRQCAYVYNSSSSVDQDSLTKEQLSFVHNEQEHREMFVSKYKLLKNNCRWVVGVLLEFLFRLRKGQLVSEVVKMKDSVLYGKSSCTCGNCTGIFSYDVVMKLSYHRTISMLFQTQREQWCQVVSGPIYELQDRIMAIILSSKSFASLFIQELKKSETFDPNVLVTKIFKNQVLGIYSYLFFFANMFTMRGTTLQTCNITNFPGLYNILLNAAMHFMKQTMRPTVDAVLAKLQRLNVNHVFEEKSDIVQAVYDKKFRVGVLNLSTDARDVMDFVANVIGCPDIVKHVFDPLVCTKFSYNLLSEYGTQLFELNYKYLNRLVIKVDYFLKHRGTKDTNILHTIEWSCTQIFFEVFDVFFATGRLSLVPYVDDERAFLKQAVWNQEMIKVFNSVEPLSITMTFLKGLKEKIDEFVDSKPGSETFSAGLIKFGSLTELRDSFLSRSQHDKSVQKVFILQTLLELHWISYHYTLAEVKTMDNFYLYSYFIKQANVQHAFTYLPTHVDIEYMTHRERRMRGLLSEYDSVWVVANARDALSSDWLNNTMSSLMMMQYPERLKLAIVNVKEDESLAEQELFKKRLRENIQIEITKNCFRIALMEEKLLQALNELPIHFVDEKDVSLWRNVLLEGSAKRFNEWRSWCREEFKF